tara:strand:- start:1049 stop:1678 length:630 start_codon:yes stop_codon:yes gene_type:complete
MAQYATDVFTTEAEAKVRSRDMGLEGRTHVYEYDAQAVYMPGGSHEEYMAYYGGTPSPEALSGISWQDLATWLLDQLIYKNQETPFVKFDDEQRIVYGWASVATDKGVPLVDKQGDYIPMDTLEKAVNEFMEHIRVGHTMHEGEITGQVIHSMPLSKEIAGALGIHCEREGWIVGYKVWDEKVWDRVKSGELKAFSIGGYASSEDYNIA